MIQMYGMCVVWGEPLSQTAQSFMPELLNGVNRSLEKVSDVHLLLMLPLLYLITCCITCYYTHVTSKKCLVRIYHYEELAFSLLWWIHLITTEYKFLLQFLLLYEILFVEIILKGLWYHTGSNVTKVIGDYWSYTWINNRDYWNVCSLVVSPNFYTWSECHTRG